MKRIVGIGVYKPGRVSYRVTDFDKFNVHISGRKIIFNGMVRVSDHIGGQDVSSFQELTRVYLKQHGKWRAVTGRGTGVA
jgi:hypothetical protein